jgi:hypothetical protein
MHLNPFRARPASTAHYDDAYLCLRLLSDDLSPKTAMDHLIFSESTFGSQEMFSVSPPWEMPRYQTGSIFCLYSSSTSKVGGFTCKCGPT